MRIRECPCFPCSAYVRVCSHVLGVDMFPHVPRCSATLLCDKCLGQLLKRVGPDAVFKLQSVLRMSLELAMGTPINQSTETPSTGSSVEQKPTAKYDNQRWIVGKRLVWIYCM
jgi:hypothetical protein